MQIEPVEVNLCSSNHLRSFWCWIVQLVLFRTGIATTALSVSRYADSSCQGEGVDMDLTDWLNVFAGIVLVQMVFMIPQILWNIMFCVSPTEPESCLYFIVKNAARTAHTFVFIAESVCVVVGIVISMRSHHTCIDDAHLLGITVVASLIFLPFLIVESFLHLHEINVASCLLFCQACGCR